MANERASVPAQGVQKMEDCARPAVGQFDTQDHHIILPFGKKATISENLIKGSGYVLYYGYPTWFVLMFTTWSIRI